MMKVVNEAFDALKDYSGTIKQDQQTDYGDLLNEALNVVLGLPGLMVEICGSWVWITGNTKEHKGALKKAGFKWASKKKAWYFRPEQFCSRSKGNKTLDEIREKYGSERPKRKQSLLQGV